jgi:hypothetical protein
METLGRTATISSLTRFLIETPAVIASQAWRSRRAVIDGQTFERRPLNGFVASLPAITNPPVRKRL